MTNDDLKAVAAALPAPPVRVSSAFAFGAAEQAKVDAQRLIASATPDKWSRFGGGGSPDSIRRQLGARIDRINIEQKGTNPTSPAELGNDKWTELRRAIMGVYVDAYSAEADAPGWTGALRNFAYSYVQLAKDVAADIPNIPGKAAAAGKAGVSAVVGAAKTTIHGASDIAQEALDAAKKAADKASSAVLWTVLKVAGTLLLVAGAAVGVWYLAEKTSAGKNLAGRI